MKICPPLTLSLLFLAGGLISANAQVIVFSDSMDYADNAAIAAAWQSGTSTTESNPTVRNTIAPVPTPIAGNNPTPAGNNFLALGNSVRYRELGATLTSDFSLSFKLSHTQFSRTQSVLMLNATGTEGYALTWNSTLVNQNSGNGLVTLRRFNDTTYTDAASFDSNNNTISVPLGSNLNPNKPAVGYAVTSAPDGVQNNATYDSTYQDFVNFTLTWNNATDLLTVYIEGIERLQVTDSTYSSFSRIYIEGNSSGYFDEMVVSVVPEPGTAGILALGALGCLGFRRRARSAR